MLAIWTLRREFNHGGAAIAPMVGARPGELMLIYRAGVRAHRHDPLFKRTIGRVIRALSQSARQVQSRTRVAAPAATPIGPAVPYSGDAATVVSLTCFHGFVPVRSLYGQRNTRWLGDVRAAAAWGIRRSLDLGDRAIGEQLGVAAASARSLIARAARLRVVDAGFARLTDRVLSDLMLEEAA
ncbi:MAG: hypothetical protein V4659_00550 [Pseudomonadota bacterium]